MDQPPSSTVRLREARLEQIAALEAALACAEGAIRRLSDAEYAKCLMQRVIYARAEADALHRLFNIGA